MKTKLVCGYWRAKLGLKDFLCEERGGTGMIEIIVLIVIIIGVAGFFGDSLMKAVEAAFKKLTEFMG